MQQSTLKPRFKSRQAMRSHLESLSMFTDTELDAIMSAAKAATLGYAVAACFTVGIELDGSDIDEMHRSRR